MDSRTSKISSASPHPSLTPSQQQRGQTPSFINFKNIGSMMGIAGNDERFNLPATHENKPEDGPASLPQQYNLDDHRFCDSFDGKNILITGPTGNIGQNLFTLLQMKAKPSKVAIFIRDFDRLPTQLRNECDKVSTDPSKRYFAYKVDFDFEDPKETQNITDACQAMLKDFSGRLHHIFFCHGVINYMGGLEANLQHYKYWHVEHKKNGKGEYQDKSPEYGKVSKINVRATMQIMSICMPFVRFSAHMSRSQTSVTVLSASAGEYPWPGHTIFNMNMSSLNMLVRCAAIENAAFNVRVNAVAPGYVKNLDANNARANEEFDMALSPDQPSQNNKVLSDAANQTPLVHLLQHNGKREYIKTLQEPEEVAAEMLWLGSYSASFINGQVIVMDGGQGQTSADYDYWLRRQIKVDLFEYQKAQAKKS